MAHPLISLGVSTAVAANPGKGVNLASMELLQGTFRYGQSTQVNYNYTVPRTEHISWLAQHGCFRNRLPVGMELMSPCLASDHPTTTVLAGMGISVAGDLHPKVVGMITDVLNAHAAVGAKCLLDCHIMPTFCYQSFIFNGDGSVNGFVPQISNGVIMAYAGNAQTRLFNYPGTPGTDMTTADFQYFWKKVAAQWAGHPGLAGYGLANEPHNMPNTDDHTIWNRYAQDAINAIRSVDALTPIYVSGNAYEIPWGANPGGGMTSQNPNYPLAGTGLVYEMHFYLDHVSSGAVFDWTTEAAAGFSAGESNVHGATTSTGNIRATYGANWVALGHAVALTEIGMPQGGPLLADLANWQSSFIGAGTVCQANNIEIYAWAGGDHWTYQAFPINAIPDFKDKRTYTPLVIGALQNISGNSDINVFADANTQWGAAGTVCTVTVYNRGNLLAPLVINLTRTQGTGTLSAASVTLGTGANTSATFTYTTAGTEDAIVSFAGAVNIPSAMHFYSMDPVTYWSTDQDIAGRACLAKYKALEWLAANAYTDVFNGKVCNPFPPRAIGCNIHQGAVTGPLDNSRMAAVLAQRQLVVLRIDLIIGAGGSVPDWSLLRDICTKIVANGARIQAVVQNTYQFDNTIYPIAGKTLAQVYTDSFNQTTTMVNAFKDLVQDFEILNEVQLRPEILAQVPWNAQQSSTTAYTASTACTSLSYVLRGMADAVHTIGANAAGVPLRVILGEVGRDWGFLTWAQGVGINWDVTGFHAYTHIYDASLLTDTWYGVGGAFTNLASFGKPITLNEYNAGEIYDPNGAGTDYENVDGQPTTELGHQAVAKHLAEIMSAPQNIESVLFYELIDETNQAIPYSHFGLMFNLSTPKNALYLATAFAGGYLSVAEQAIVTNAGWLTTTQITAYKAAAAGQTTRAVYNSGMADYPACPYGGKINISPSYDGGTTALPKVLVDTNGKKYVDFSATNCWGFTSKKVIANAGGAGTDPSPTQVTAYNLTDAHFMIVGTYSLSNTPTGTVGQTGVMDGTGKAQINFLNGVPRAIFQDGTSASATITGPSALSGGSAHIVSYKFASGAQSLRVDGAQVATGTFAPAATPLNAHQWGFDFSAYFTQSRFGGGSYGYITGKGAPTAGEMLVMEQYLARIAGTTLPGSPTPPPTDYPSGVAALTAWFDPSTLSTLLQSSASGGAVTAAGQVVGQMNDRVAAGPNLTIGDSQRFVIENAAGLWYLDTGGNWNNTGGGGATTAFYFACAFKLWAGWINTFWCDSTGLNNGYELTYNGPTDKLVFSVGTGAARVSIASSTTLNFTTGGPYVVSAWDDGTNLNLQINNGAVASIAHGAVSAGGTTAFVCEKDNVQTNINYIKNYGLIWAKNSALNSTDRAGIKTYLGAKAGLVL